MLRCVASLVNQGATKGNLIDQINELNKTNSDRFTGDIKDWAHNIRIFGNWGCHPNEDNLQQVDKEICEDIINFMNSYFKYVYEMPAEVKKARMKTNKPNNNN